MRQAAKARKMSEQEIEDLAKKLVEAQRIYEASPNSFQSWLRDRLYQSLFNSSFRSEDGEIHLLIVAQITIVGIWGKKRSCKRLYL